MKIAMGSDHAAVDERRALAGALAGAGHEILDLGTDDTASVDYPDFARAVAEAVARGEADRGILICGTGIGMSMTANKTGGIRAALCTGEFMAEMARRHNDANVLCLGARILAPAAMERIAGVWLDTPFDGGRHERRVKKIDR